MHKAVAVNGTPIMKSLLHPDGGDRQDTGPPASLQVRGLIAAIFAQMDVVDLMEQQLVAAAQNDLLAGIASDEIDTDAEPGRLKARNAKKPRDGAFLGSQGWLVAGAGFEPAAFGL